VLQAPGLQGELDPSYSDILSLKRFTQGYVKISKLRRFYTSLLHFKILQTGSAQQQWI